MPHPNDLGHGRPAGVPPFTIRQHGRDRPCPLDKPSQAALLLRLQRHGYGLGPSALCSGIS